MTARLEHELSMLVAAPPREATAVQVRAVAEHAGELIRRGGVIPPEAGSWFGGLDPGQRAAAVRMLQAGADALVSSDLPPRVVLAEHAEIEGARRGLFALCVAAGLAPHGVEGLAALGATLVALASRAQQPGAPGPVVTPDVRAAVLSTGPLPSPVRERWLALGESRAWVEGVAGHQPPVADDLLRRIETRQRAGGRLSLAARAWRARRRQETSVAVPCPRPALAARGDRAGVEAPRFVDLGALEPTSAHGMLVVRPEGVELRVFDADEDVRSVGFGGKVVTARNVSDGGFVVQIPYPVGAVELEVVAASGRLVLAVSLRDDGDPS